MQSVEMSQARNDVERENDEAHCCESMQEVVGQRQLS